MITMRRKHCSSGGVAAVVLAALGIGFGVGFAISSKGPSTSAVKVVTDASLAPVPSHSTTRTASPPTAPAATLPTVASCRPGQKPQVRPASIDIGCAGDDRVSDVTWSTWERSTGDGSGTLTVRSCRPSCAAGSVSGSPAFVVVSGPPGRRFPGRADHSADRSPHSAGRLSPRLGWGSGERHHAHRVRTWDPLAPIDEFGNSERGVDAGRDATFPSPCAFPDGWLSLSRPCRQYSSPHGWAANRCTSARRSEWAGPRTLLHVQREDQLRNRSFRADRFRPPSGTPDRQEIPRSVDHDYRRTNREIAGGGPPWVQLTFVGILWRLMMRIVSGVNWRESRSKT